MPKPGGEGRRATARIAVAALLALGVAGALSACGGDDEPVATPPTTTGPTGAPASEGSGDSDGKPGGGDVSEPPVTESPTGGEPDQPTAGGTPPPAPEEDTEEHDIPPPPGSPAEQFEHECEANPEICE
jgi:hypothetical protein